VVPIQRHYGWRASFYVFGVVGLVWATTWYRWFRDTPAEKNQLTPLVHASESMESHATRKPFLWRDALRSPDSYGVESGPPRERAARSLDEREVGP